MGTVWAAIRYRRAQASVLVLLSALITACAVFAPLYERGLEQALLRRLVDSAAPAETALYVRAGRSPTSPDLRSSQLVPAVPEAVRALHEPGIGMLQGTMAVVPRQGLRASPGELIARDRACEHLTITAGSCPTRPGDVLVSAKDLAAWNWALGQQFETPITSASEGTPPARLTIAGAYEVVRDDAYWLRTEIDGKSGTTISLGLDLVPALDTWVTPESTFSAAWSEAQASVAFPLRRSLITLDTLSEVSAALANPSTVQGGGVNGALVESPLPALVEQVRNGQEQVRVIVPLLMAQLGLLAAAVLLLVAQAAVEQRRPEVALARLRGRSRDGAGRLVMTELGLTVLVGLPLGFALAVGMSETARRFVLPPGVPFELPVLTLVAVTAAAVVCALSIWVAARPVQRQSISSLLRRVAPPVRSGLGVVDILSVALAVFGIIGLATGSLDGPLAMVTPTLIALAAGLVASRLAVPVAGVMARTQLARGQVGPALTGFGLQRRPALRKVVTVVSVATALAVFAANATAVADRNRSSRARLEVGAPAVLLTDSRQPSKLVQAVQKIDPSGERATPVGVARPRDAGAPATMAVVADGFAAVAFPVAGGERLRLSELSPPAVEPVLLRGERVTGRVAWDLSVPAEGRVPRDAVPGQSGRPVEGDAGLPPPVPSELRLAVTMPDGQRLTRTLMSIPLSGKGSQPLSAPLLCPQGCRLDALEFRKLDDFSHDVEGTLTLHGLGVDGTSLGVSDTSRWLPFTAPTPEATDVMRPVGASGDALTVELVNSGFVGRLAHADVPAVVPGLLAGEVPPGGTAQSFPATGINGGQLSVRPAQRLDALPRLGERGVVVDLQTVARLGGQLPDRGTLSVWLADDSPTLVREVTAELAAEGIGVLGTTTYAGAKEDFDQSASGWGLRLALFAGAMALVMAALVLIVMTVTGWRVVARDMGALQMSGIPLATLRRSLVREQVLLVVVGVTVGVACGVLTSALAMPLIPLFDAPAAVPVLQLQPSLLAVTASAAVAALALLLVGVVVAAGAGRAIELRRIRESL